MSKTKDLSEVPTPLISWAVVQELASESIDSDQAPAIDEMIGEGKSVIVGCRRSPEDFDEEATARKALAPNDVQGVPSEISISVPKSDRDRSRTVRRVRKRLRAVRRMERCTESRVQRYKTVPENRSKLLY